MILRPGSPEEQSAYLVDAFNGIKSRPHRNQPDNAADFLLLEQRLDTLGLTGEPAERARVALENARNHALGK